MKFLLRLEKQFGIVRMQGTCRMFLASFGLLAVSAIANAATVATPTFSPVAGTYTSTQAVAISTTTSGASIRYTTNGSTPTATVGTLYVSGSPVSIGVTTTLKAIAFKSGSTNSSVTSGLYTINLPVVAAPTFSPVAGTYTSVQSVAISTTASGASIRYTTDGSTPSATAGTLYVSGSPVSVGVTTTLKAIAFKSGSTNSNVTSGLYTINLPVVAVPTFSPVAGTYTSVQAVTISSTTSGASIRYTTDGSTPSSSVGTLYVSGTPVSVGATTTLKAIAFKSGSTNSSVTTGLYTINLPVVAAPIFSPTAGTYTSAQTVTITSTTSGSSIRYTTDGTTPSATQGTLYTSPVDIGVTTTLKAIALKSGSTDSSVTSGVYTVNLPVSTPTFSPVAGAYMSTQMVAIATTTSGASIRFTTDGSLPSSTVGALYAAPVGVAVTSTLKAIAYKSGLPDSGVASATYAINRPPLPYSTDFESGQGYILGSLNGQLGWTVGPGISVVSNSDFSHGAQSVQLSPNTPPSVIGQTFAAAAGETVEFFDFYAKPVSGTPPGTASTFTIEESEFAFQLSGSQGILQTYHGNGSGGGTWTPTAFSIPLTAGHQALNWVRLTARLDFTRQLWDLYANSQMVAADIPFISPSTYLSNFQLQGDVSTASGLDDILAGPANPLFADVNNDGIDDAWETAHGLSLVVNNRDLSPAGNGVTVLQAYLAGTDPNDFYNGATPTVTIVSGNNQVTESGQFNAQPCVISVKNAAGSASLINAPVTFTVQSGGGKLALTNTGSPTLSNSVNLITDVNGTAQVYYRQPPTASVTSFITLTAGAAQTTFSTASAAIVDSDQNGLADNWEIQYFGSAGVNPSADADGDGLTNLQEFQQGTSPINADMDGDGIFDGVEVSHGMNPLVPDAETLPGKISGLRLLLKSDNGVTVDGSGNVSVWQDQSGLGNHAAQTSAGRRPSMVPSAINGQPLVRFDGNDKWFNLPNSMDGATEGEAFIVLKTVENQAATWRALWETGAGAYPHYPLQNGSIDENWGSSVVRNIGRPSQPMNQYHLYNVSSQAGDWASRINGSLLYRTAANSVYFCPAPYLGRNIDVGWGYNTFYGDIAEVIFYNHVLTAQEREAVGIYLTRKFALPSIAVPAAPTNLSAVSLSATQVNLAWVAPPGFEGLVYTIERQTGGGAYTFVAEVNNDVGYTDAGVVAGTSYSYRVKARSYAGGSGYSNVATATTFNSGDGLPVSGMRLWLEADRGLIAQGTLSVWQDQSGLHNDAVQTVGPKQPILVADQLNGRQVVRFDGSDKYLKLPAVMGGASAGEAFIVLKTEENQAATWRALWEIGAGPYPHYPLQDGSIDEDWGSSVVRNIGRPAQPLNQYHLYNVSSQTGDWACRINGSLLYRTTTNSVYFRADPSLGRNNVDGSYNTFYGDIAEVIFYDHVLTTVEREAVGVYLTRKFALPSAPVPSAPANLSAVWLSATQVNLAWVAPAVFEGLVYTIERQIGAGDYTFLAEVNGDLGYTDSGVSADTLYNYRVKARSYAGSSSYSNVATATNVPVGPVLPVGGMRLWLEAGRGLIAQGKVSVWQDQSGLHNDAVQMVGANQPSVVGNQLNGRPVMRFDGSDKWFNLPNLMSGVTAGEAFVVLKTVENQAATWRALWQTGAGPYPHYPLQNGSIDEDWGSSVVRNIGAPSQPLNQYHVYNVSSRPGDWACSINGNLQYRTGTNSVYFRTDPYLGRNNDNGWGYNTFYGDIAEVIFYDHALAPLDREAVTRYLALKYDLIPGYLDSGTVDSNGDGLADSVNIQLGIDPHNMDVDGDGILNAVEITNGTNPIKADTDGDGVIDSQDSYPLDPTRWLAASPNPGDTTSPVITLTIPANAVLLP